MVNVTPRLSQETPLMDFERLRRIVDTKEEEIEIIELFFRQAENLLVTMAGAVHEKELSGWKHALHSLRGSADNLGMHSLVQKCTEAETPMQIASAERHVMLEDIKREVQRIQEYANSVLEGKP